MPKPLLGIDDDYDNDDEYDDDDGNNDDVDKFSVPRPLLGDDQTFGSNIDTLYCTAESALNSTHMGP